MSNRQNQDSHTGGSLYDWAKDGTTVPNDAGLQNTVPSYPRPSQTSESTQFDNQGLEEPSLAFAADNPKDVPRSTKDVGETGEVITGTGDALPSEIETKRLSWADLDPGAKGSTRNEKHDIFNRSAFDRKATDNPNANWQSGEHQGRNQV
ncbi:hypothetical protein MPDQ_000508 [Monascus purpureus]|uniref:Uncharacterized protein n=1 Tax=Monascus purpureus TaxID=5098 RepID=A0A507R4H7_MONPU|nr:hypothetical protein MPDQ_000508 [Monascus purpureus]BDD64083.1 hypothetical protein MAP00_008929 [Monascus purpureus]